MENDLLEDPFLQPKFESKPRVFFTRSKVTNTKEFELKSRPEKTATGTTLTEKDLGSTLQFKVNRECRVELSDNKFRRKRSSQHMDELYFNDYSDSEHEDILHILKDVIKKRIVSADPTITS